MRCAIVRTPLLLKSAKVQPTTTTVSPGGPCLPLAIKGKLKEGPKIKLSHELGKTKPVLGLKDSLKLTPSMTKGIIAPGTTKNVSTQKLGFGMGRKSNGAGVPQIKLFS